MKRGTAVSRVEAAVYRFEEFKVRGLSRDGFVIAFVRQGKDSRNVNRTNEQDLRKCKMNREIPPHLEGIWRVFCSGRGPLMPIQAPELPFRQVQG